VTTAQEEILRYLVRRGIVTGVGVGDLLDYYESRARAEAEAAERLPSGRSARDYWRGVLQLRRMREAGLLRQRGSSYGTPLYDVTADGFDAIAE
jgi:hypothetical protein